MSRHRQAAQHSSVAQVCAQHNSCICKLNICSKNTGCEWRPHSTLHCPISIIHIHLRSAALTSNEEIFCKQQKHAETDVRVSLCLRCFIFLFSNYVHCIKHILVDILNLVDRLFYISSTLRIAWEVNVVLIFLLVH